jgi:hypothetical protein
MHVLAVCGVISAALYVAIRLGIEPPRDCRRQFFLSHAATAVSANMA